MMSHTNKMKWKGSTTAWEFHIDLQSIAENIIHIFILASSMEYSTLQYSLLSLKLVPGKTFSMYQVNTQYKVASTSIMTMDRIKV